jgi:hypothetical protein
MIVTPTCRFCQGHLKQGGSQTKGNQPYTEVIYFCNKCESQQHYKYDASPLSFSFYTTTDVGNRYYIHFDPRTMKLHITQVLQDNQAWKPCVDIHLSEIPAWLRPNNVSEIRIRTMMVFS